MHKFRSVLAAASTAWLALCAAAARAHEGPYLSAHSHPHLGIEHLAISAAAVLLAYWLLRGVRR